MKILALETSSDLCSVALLLDDRCLASLVLAPKSHTQLLLPMIDGLFKEASISLEAVDALTFGIGPGSFTGLRIACSIIQGLSVGQEKPIVALSSLRVLAQRIYRESHHPRVFAYVEAGRGQIYGGYYAIDTHNLMQAVGSDAVYSAESLKTQSAQWKVATGYAMAQDLLGMAVESMQAGHTVRATDLHPEYLASLFQKQF